MYFMINFTSAVKSLSGDEMFNNAIIIIVNKVLFCCFISAKVAFTERVYFFRPKSKNSANLRFLATKKVAKKRCRTQRETGDTLSRSFVLGRRQSGSRKLKRAFEHSPCVAEQAEKARLAGANWFRSSLLSSGAFWPRVRTRRKPNADKRVSEKWNTIVYKQTNKLLLVIIERKRETKKIQFLHFAFFLQNIHQLDTVHLVRGGVGTRERDLGRWGKCNNYNQ